LTKELEEERQNLEDERKKFDEEAQKNEAERLALIQEVQQLKQGGTPLPGRHTAPPSTTSNKGPTKPRVGGLRGDIPWTGGTNIRTERLTSPRSAKALRPQEWKSLIKSEEICTQGLAPSKRLDIASKSGTITLTQWIKEISEYMEDRGMDTVFRIYNHASQSEIYLFEKWSVVSKDNVINNWVADLKKGIPLLSGKKAKCSYDLDNLNWSSKALKNSVSPTLWESLSRSLKKDATGPEVFKSIIMKYKFLNASTIRTLEDNLKSLKIIEEPGQDINKFSEKVAELAAQIEGASEIPPSDLSLTVCNTFLTCTEELFKFRMMELHNNVERDPSSMHWHDLITELKMKYDGLVVQKLWQAANSRSKNKDNELAAMNAVKKLEQKLTKFEQTARPTLTSTKPTSTSTSTYPRAKVTPVPTSTQSNASNANTHETIPWWQVPPEPGASQVKTIRVKSGSNSGKLQTRKWCQICEKWTFHSTEGHDEWVKNKQVEDKDKKTTGNQHQGNLTTTSKSTVPSNNSVTFDIPSDGALKMLSNTLFLAEKGTLDPDKPSTFFCQPCSGEAQFEIDEIDCYTGIPTADILEEMEK
jgi:hypothetical protein